MFISKDMVSDKYGAHSPGPVYNPKTVDGKFYTPAAHSFGASHRYALSAQKHINTPNPGPGQYHMPGSMSKQPDSKKLSYSSWKFGTSTRKDQAKGAHGPIRMPSCVCAAHSSSASLPLCLAQSARSHPGSLHFSGSREERH
jgi:hypothetical protein